jgi:hypothetical protein
MIKIEVTGASIAEVADKLLAIGSSLRGNAASEAPRLRAALEVAEVAPAPEPSAGPAAPEPAAETTGAEPSASPATASPSEITAEAMRDLVLRVVKTKGREAMVAVLDTFGAAKASDVPAAQVPELVTALEALL